MLSTYELFTVSVSCIYHDIQKIQRAVMAEYGLKGPHARCLIALSHYPDGVTAAQLSQTYEKDKAAISRTVAELEQMGLVQRTMPGGSRYRARLSLTPQGRIIAETVNKAAELAVGRAGEGLNENDRQVFYSVLGRIAENLHTICKDGLTEAKGE